MGVIDETDSTTFILFDRDPSTLINKSYAELFESHDKVNFSNVHMFIYTYKKSLLY